MRTMTTIGNAIGRPTAARRSSGGRAATASPGQRRLRAAVTGEEGSVSAELVVATPLLLLLLLAAVQAGVWWHATHIAESVAAHALAAARVQDGSAASGERSGRLVIAQLAGNLLSAPQIVVTRGPAAAKVEVTGSAMSVIPGLALPVRAAATGAPEPPR